MPFSKTLTFGSIILKQHLLIKSIFLLFLITACNSHEASHTEFALGTVCTVTLYDQGQPFIYNDIFTRLREIENLMSVNIPSSDVSLINSAAGEEKVFVNKDVFYVLERALFFASFSGGAFDPSIGPIVSLWGIGSEKSRVPSHEEIEKILPLVNWRNIELETQTCCVFLKDKGMAVDLGAIAKGYAADEIAAILKKYKTDRAIIDLGGDIVVFGIKKDKSPWRVGIQNPNPGEGRGDYIGVLHIPGIENGQRTIVTSGVYERFLEKDGRRYHHIFSPENGYPAENGLLSVTVIARLSMDADALSTAVFVLGYENGKKLIDTFPGAEAVFIFEDNSVIKTSGIDFTLTNKSYDLKP